ncbi:acyl carrier protein [Nonomuraea sp. SYSU D8015]|uniref:acyl carrier protein n=1 Tax=Nonomuraea sp. SYSU D8015 TaxID=2593644 RepID=UPI0016608979|nr:acyl carrier protein [Nonomuraea sp. SYSU D8015]
MAETLTEREVSARLLDFIWERFLYDDPTGEFDESSPLLESGILTSLNTAILLNFIFQEWGTVVPVEQIDPRAFHTVSSIASMLCAKVD